MENCKSGLIDTLSLDERIRLFNGEGSWNTYTANGKVPGFSMSDGPHGLRKQDFENYGDINKSNVATCFPTASCLASSWNKKNAASLGIALSKEAVKEKVDVVLGPGVNIKRSPLCGRNFEYFSEDPYLAGTLAAEYVNALQSQGPGTSLKHFACNNQEKRRQISNSIVDERTLHEIYLRAFEITVKKAQPHTVMASYNRLNGVYACANEKLLTDILRNKWQFKGIVISDWGACMDAARCVKAGLDLAMPDSVGYYGRSLKQSLAEGVIKSSHLDEANQRLLGLARKYRNAETESQTQKPLDYSDQHKTAFDIAADSIVLLKNENVLPVKKGKLAVIGELAEFMKFQGGGSSHITTAEYPSALDSFVSEGYEVLYSKGYYSGFCPEKLLEKKNGPLMEPALELARDARKMEIPLVFFTGLTEQYEGEGFDRTNLSLPAFQLKLLDKVLEITDNVIVVNFSGAPVVFPFKNKVKAIVQMYLCGEACGEVTAAVLSGRVNPSGKLAETFPLKEEDVPCCKNFALEENNVEYREQLFVGYRHYETNNIPVEYEFGYGLSYTKFEYSNLTLALPQVTVDVTNCGSVAGSEVVQLYVVNPPVKENCEVKRASKELRGFEKVYLEPGETKTVSILLDDYAFKVYSTKTGNFETAGGEYKIQAAASIKDVRLEESIHVDGEELENLCDPVTENFYRENRIQPHGKGSFTLEDCLEDISKESRFARKFLNFIIWLEGKTVKTKSKEDPAYKILISSIKEGPLESLIVFSGSEKIEKLVKFVLKKANRK